MTPAKGTVTRGQLLAFSLPMTSMWFMHGPVAGILPAIYAKYFGIALATTGTILLVSRILDAATDPLIGYLSDHTRSPLGRRKPWIIAGALLSMTCVYFLFMPGDAPTAFYYGFWLILLLLGWTMSEIPYTAWGTELTRSYDGRSRTFTYRAWFREIGSLAFLMTPIIMFYFGFSETSEMTPQTLGVVAIGILISLPISIMIAVTYAPTGEEVSTTAKLSIRELVESLRVNKPFRMFLPIYVVAGIAVGMYGAMSFIYVDSYLLIGDKFAYIHVAALIVALMSYPLWLWIIHRFGKHRSWSVSNIVFGLGIMPIALIEPGESSFIPYLVLYLFGSLVQGAGSIVPPSLLSDVIDYDIYKTGTNRAASYLSLTTLLFKANMAIGSALAFYLLSFFEFDIDATSQSASGAMGVWLTGLFIPGALFAIAGIMLWFFPIDNRRADIIVRWIERRAARQGLATA